MWMRTVEVCLKLVEFWLCLERKVHADGLNVECGGKR
jgi:hypothetical protein